MDTSAVSQKQASSALRELVCELEEPGLMSGPAPARLEALRHQVLAARELFRAAPVAYGLLSAEGEIVEANRELMRLCPPTAGHATMASFFVLADQPTFAAVLERCGEHPGQSVRAHLRLTAGQCPVWLFACAGRPPHPYRVVVVPADNAPDGADGDGAMLVADLKIRTAALEDATRELQSEVARRHRLEQGILQISETEQRRIGQDLHDGLSQYLASINYYCHTLARRLEHRKLPEAAEARRVCELLVKAMIQTRQLARGLHPLGRGRHGTFLRALRELAATTTELFSIECRLVADSPAQLPDVQTATHLYRITQEAIHNAIKHGRARRITIHCQRRENRLVLAVANDGRSIQHSLRRARGLGLDTMSYRADVIGASLTVRPARPRGTVVTCSVPLCRDPQPRSSS